VSTRNAFRTITIEIEPNGEIDDITYVFYCGDQTPTGLSEFIPGSTTRTNLEEFARALQVAAQAYFAKQPKDD
jgi:hypothetical protein